MYISQEKFISAWNQAAKDNKTQSDVARELGVTRQAVSLRGSRLLKKGLLTHSLDSYSRRPKERRVSYTRVASCQECTTIFEDYSAAKKHHAQSGHHIDLTVTFKAVYGSKEQYDNYTSS